MFRPRRRPLMRAAMVGGVGYAAGRRGANTRAREGEQEQRLEALEQQQAPAPAAAAMAPPTEAPAAAPAAGGGVDIVGELTKLKGLLDAGVLNQEEFEAAKAKVLA
jgi:putative oligomerization/nucleic acid binding protein